MSNIRQNMDSLDNTFTAYNKNTNTMYLLNPAYYSSRYKETKYHTVMGIYRLCNKKLFDLEIRESKRIRIVKNGKVLVKFKKVKYFIWFLQSLFEKNIYIKSLMDLNEFFGKLGSRGIKFYEKYSYALNKLQCIE